MLNKRRLIAVALAAMSAMSALELPMAQGDEWGSHGSLDLAPRTATKPSHPVLKTPSVVSVGMAASYCPSTSSKPAINTTATGATAKYNGATEVLTFTDCGPGTYSGPGGYSGAITLVHSF